MPCRAEVRGGGKASGVSVSARAASSTACSTVSATTPSRPHLHSHAPSRYALQRVCFFQRARGNNKKGRRRQSEITRPGHPLLTSLLSVPMTRAARSAQRAPTGESLLPPAGPFLRSAARCSVLPAASSQRAARLHRACLLYYSAPEGTRCGQVQQRAARKNTTPSTRNPCAFILQSKSSQNRRDRQTPCTAM